MKVKAKSIISQYHRSIVMSLASDNLTLSLISELDLACKITVLNETLYLDAILNDGTILCDTHDIKFLERINQEDLVVNFSLSIEDMIEIIDIDSP